jgi:hypothetical protein
MISALYLERILPRRIAFLSIQPPTLGEGAVLRGDTPIGCRGGEIARKMIGEKPKGMELWLFSALKYTKPSWGSVMGMAITVATVGLVLLTLSYATKLQHRRNAGLGRGGQ